MLMILPLEYSGTNNTQKNRGNTHKGRMMMDRLLKIKCMILIVAALFLLITACASAPPAKVSERVDNIEQLDNKAIFSFIIMSDNKRIPSNSGNPGAFMFYPKDWLADPDVPDFLHINRFNNIMWFHKESLDRLCWWMLTVAAIRISDDPFCSYTEKRAEIASAYNLIALLQQAEDQSGYRVQRLLEVLRD